MISRQALRSTVTAKKPAGSLAAMSPSRARTQTTAAATAAKPLTPPADRSLGVMLQHQPSLPHLPVPPLSHTIPLYLSTLKPLANCQTPLLNYSKSASMANSFINSPLAQELQKRLVNRAENEGRESWLKEWWDDVAYMSWRDAVVPGSNYYYIHKSPQELEGDKAQSKTQSRRAAELVMAYDAFRGLIESKTLSPDMIKTTPLDMSCHHLTFNSSRIPTAGSDTYETYPGGVEGGFVVVLRNGRFWKVQISGRAVDAIEKDFETILSSASSSSPGIPIASLTTLPRDEWLSARKSLIDLSPSNAEALKIIQASMFIVSLSDEIPTYEGVKGERESWNWDAWSGAGDGGRGGPSAKGERWFDKHNLIVYPNGRSAFNGEHSLLDGTPTLRLNEFVLSSLQNQKIDLEPASSKKSGSQMVEIKFKTDDSTEKDVKKAIEVFEGVMSKHDMAILHYTTYGSSLIKQFKTSPDAWVQLIMQLAFNKFKGRPGVCYESCQTRKFLKGRTEVIRSASEESRIWAEAVLKGDAKPSVLRSHFREAVSRHLKYAALAADGMGVDRHLYGLKKMLKEGEEVPGIFKDEAFSKSNHWEMSTSSLLSLVLDGWGYGEVVPDGYGLSYSVGPDYLRFTLTSLKLETKEFKECLRWAADQVKNMMELAAQEDAEGVEVATPRSKL